MVVSQDKQNLAANLVSLKSQADGIILWLDCDREGECIAYECLKVIGNFKGAILRAKFSSLDRGQIERAFRTLGQLNPHLNDAVEARREIDLRIGCVFTRF